MNEDKREALAKNINIQRRKKKEKRGIDYKGKYLRALADYQNLLKRVEKERAEFARSANETLIEKLLPILDDLERAMNVTGEKGIALIYNKFWQILEREGLERIKIEGKEFNPIEMECVKAEKNGKKLVEICAGYVYKGEIIRPALVKVVR